MFNLLGSKGVPLNGDPSAFHAFSKIFLCLISSLVGRPSIFWCWSYRSFSIADCVSSSKSLNGLELLTFEVSISTSPFMIVDQIFSLAFSRLNTKNGLPSVFSTIHVLSFYPELILSNKFPYRITSLEILFVTLRCSGWIFTSKCFARVPFGKGTVTLMSLDSWLQVYLSVFPPL